MKIGFIGLGIMGQPMARNLLKARSASKVANKTTTIFTMLPIMM